MRLQYRNDNQIDLLVRGADYFPRLLEAINAAQHEVLLETYIYENDPTGRAVTDALCAAAQRGARVHVMVDGVGARTFAMEFRRRFNEAGVQFMTYRPLTVRFGLQLPLLRRLHRKLVSIDGSVGFVGGINIIDDLNSHVEEPQPPRLDYAVQVRGPLVADIQYTMRRLWTYASRRWLSEPFDAWPELAPPPPPAGRIRAALAIRDNFRRRHQILAAHLIAINHARQEIVLAHAYFWPGRRLLRALCRASARGVKVRVLLQGQPDHPLLYYATRFLYDRLLRSGIEIHEYSKSHLHAKAAVIDRRWATVGSSNVDPLSLLLAREGNVIVDDAGFAAQLHESIARETREGGQPILRGTRRSLWERFRVRVSYEVVRVMANFVGFRA